jgi:hypothetical protein
VAWSKIFGRCAPLLLTDLFLLCHSKSEEVKLSSLEHAILPSTKVSVHAVDVTLPLKVSVSARPDYPFVSTLKLSLGDAPECNVRITPLSSERYVQGRKILLVSTLKSMKSLDVQLSSQRMDYPRHLASKVDCVELT